MARPRKSVFDMAAEVRVGQARFGGGRIRLDKTFGRMPEV